MRRLTLMFSILLAGAGLAGCAEGTMPTPLPRAVIEATAEARLVPAGQAWVATPADLVLQRSVGREAEQTLSLPNVTSLRGDNRMVLRTRGSDGLPVGTFRLEDALSLAGGAPFPFTRVTEAGLTSGRDDLGTYFWVQRSVAGGVTCVLALRRLDGTQRPMPGRARALDIVLRNCVPGSAEVALAPIRGAELAFARTGTAQTAAGAPRTLSPFAAPMVR